MIRTRKLPCIIIAVAFAAPVPAYAQSATDLLQRGQQAYEEAQFDDAAALFHRALDPRVGAGEVERVRAVSYLAAIYAAQNYRDIARTWFRWLLRQQGGFQLDTVLFGPDVQTILALAAEGVEPRRPDRNVTLRWEWHDINVLGPRGHLVVRATPVTASVTVNGTPYLGPDAELIPGTYTLDITAPGHESWREAVEVLPGATAVLAAALVRPETQPGWVYVASIPWGLVTIDGVEVGFTLLARHPLTPGQHQLRVEAPGYEPYAASITVVSGQALRLGTIPLRRLPQRGNQ